MFDRRYPHLSRLEERPTWLSTDEAVRARAFAKTVCDKVMSLRACWNNAQRALFFYYGDDVENAGWTYELVAHGVPGMYAPLLSQDVDDLLYALSYGRKSAAEKDAIMASNEKVVEKRRQEGLTKMVDELTPEIKETMRSRDQERRGVKKLIVG